jgi:hypothetical protein
VAQKSSGSNRRSKTLVPAKRNVAMVVIQLPMWNSGPEFRNTVSWSTRWRLAIIRFSMRNPRCDSIAPLGRPLKAAV